MTQQNGGVKNPGLFARLTGNFEKCGYFRLGHDMSYVGTAKATAISWMRLYGFAWVMVCVFTELLYIAKAVAGEITEFNILTMVLSLLAMFLHGFANIEVSNKMQKMCGKNLFWASLFTPWSIIVSAIVFPAWFFTPIPLIVGYAQQKYLWKNHCLLLSDNGAIEEELKEKPVDPVDKPELAAFFLGQK